MKGVLAPQTGTAFVLKAGMKLKVVDYFGAQVSDLFCFSENDQGEWLSSGRSIDYNDTLFLSTGHLLYSNRSGTMLKIVEDTCGRHDFLMPPCSLQMFRIVAGDAAYHPSCHENLALGFEKFGIHADEIATTFNIFMNVSVDPEGKIGILPPLSRAGDFIVFEAMMDLVVGLTGCAHEGSNAGTCKAVHYEISGPPSVSPNP